MPDSAPATIDAYIATFPADVQPILNRVYAALKQALPDAPERIRYGMPALMLDDTRYAIHFGGWKKHVGLYPVSPLPEPLESEVAPYRSAKDTVKFLYADPLPDELITRVGEALRRT